MLIKNISQQGQKGKLNGPLDSPGARREMMLQSEIPIKLQYGKNLRKNEILIDRIGIIF
jgi:hypothetical protein